MSQIPDFPSNRNFFEPDYYLPNSYGETYIVLMVRDPDWIFAYWEVSQDKRQNFVQKHGKNSWNNSRMALRLVWKNGEKKIIKLNDEADNWYINVGDKGIPKYGELGRLFPDGRFIVLAVSNDLSQFGINTVVRLKYKAFIKNISYRKGW